MKALVYKGPKKVEVENVELNKKESDSIKIKVKYCGVCGSDIGIYLGTHPRAKAPLVLGHEFLGIVQEDGEKFKKGDRVVAYPLISCGNCTPCREGNEHVCKTLGLIGIDVDGGIREEFYVNEDVLFKVPDKVSDKAASVIEPLAVIIRAINQAKFRPRDKVAIIGAGPIGILTGIAVKNFGAENVIISDVSEKRLKVAKELGLTTVNVGEENLNDVISDVTNGDGADVTFECSGSESSAIEITQITKISGTICMLSVHKQAHKVDLRELNFKEQTIVGSRVYTKREFEKAVNYSEVIETELEKVVTHIIPLSESEKVFDLIADTNNGTIKVLIDCSK